MRAPKTFLTVFAVALLAGCTETHNFYTVVPDFGGTAPDLSTATPCTPMDVECVGTTSFRECHADGTWGTDIACELGNTCQQGVCQEDPNSLPCNPGDGVCVSGMAYTCRDSGAGFNVAACPSGTQCVGPGQCIGACGAVGQAFCGNDPTSIFTCDGTTITLTACPAAGSDGRANLCVAIGDSAACKPSDCNPDTDCDVCGNPSDSTIDPTANTSTCTATPGGYRWATSACDAPTTCDPSANGVCFGPQTGAGCDSECTPGDHRCLAGNQLQICGSDGKWGAATQCNNAAGETCVSLNGVAVCADPVCTIVAKSSAITGACVLADGKTQIRTCDPSTGHLIAPQPCAIGLCHGIGGQSDDGLQPGTCNVECSPGEKICADAAGLTELAIETCQNGIFGAPVTCALDAGTGSSCQQFTDPNGQRSALCGICPPGSTRCVTAGLQTCAPDGQTWGAAVACVGSTCRSNPDGTGFCVADCIPASKVCVGDPAASPFPISLGLVAEVTCNSDGTIPAAPTCPGAGCCATGTSCRSDLAGNSLGCVVCVGGLNEVGLTDTRCSNAAGTAEVDGGPAVQTCNATSTGWLAAKQCGAPIYECVDPDFNAGNPAYCAETGLVVYYPFSGDTTDHSGNGFDAVLQGSPVPTLTTDACGNANSAYSFAGGRIELLDPDSNLPSAKAPRTLTLWFKTSQSTNVGDFANWGSDAVTGGRFGLIFDTGAQGFKFVGQGADLASNHAVGDGQWHFGAVTYNGTTAILYLDARAPVNGAVTLNTVASSELEIGERVDNFDEPLTGSVDEVRIYNRVLTPVEIATLRGLPCP